MSLTAYQRTLKATENTRDVEYRLLGQVTRALIDAASLPRTDARVIDAIDWNRRVWTAFSNDCYSDGNGMTVSLRAGIVSLAIFVARYSSQAMHGGMSFEPLIDINRMIMQGLAARAAA